MNKKPIANDYEEWLIRQRTKVGGSDIPTIFGLFGSWYELWARKTGRDPGFEGNDITWLGNRSEQIVADHFMETYDVKVVQDNFIRYSEEVPFLGVNLDRRIYRHPKFDMKAGIQQIKTTSQNAYDKAMGDAVDGIPYKYLLQVITEMHCAEVEFGVISVLVLGDYSRFFEHKFIYMEDHLDLLEEIKENVRIFWQYVETDTPPPIVNSKDTAIAYPESVSEDAVRADATVMDLLSKMKSQYKAMRAYYETKGEARLQMEKLMKDSEELYSKDGDHLASWVTTTGQKFDEKSFAKDHPKLHKEYQKQTSTRRFNFKT